MMMKTAGGPGLVSPLDYGERKKPLPRATVIAVAVVVLAHVGVGAALYYQKFELTPTETTTEPPSITISMERPIIPPEPQKPQPQEPQPATNNIHETPAPTLPTPTIFADTSSPPSTNPGPVIAFEDPAPVAPAVVAEPPRTPPVITRPQWASQPSAAQMSRAYPERALTDGISGAASLTCTVSAAGTLIGAIWRTSPATLSGRPVRGSAAPVASTTVVATIRPASVSTAQPVSIREMLRAAPSTTGASNRARSCARAATGSTCTSSAAWTCPCPSSDASKPKARRVATVRSPSAPRQMAGAGFSLIPA
nr:hypothetical protein [Brevundimonas goettingensis]